MARAHGYEDVEARWAEIDETAHVSSAAVVGSPGEWIGKPTVYPAIIGPRVVVREFARVHAGCIRETRIGADTLLMAGSHVGHDAILGEGVHLAPNVVVPALRRSVTTRTSAWGRWSSPTRRSGATASWVPDRWSPGTSRTVRSGPATPRRIARTPSDPFLSE